MKYKLINKTTKEEHICEKVVIDGWDYYVSDERPKAGDCVIEYQKADAVGELHFINGEYVLSVDIQEKVIATNNPSIDIPKVVDEVDIIGETACEIANVSLNWYKDKNNKDRDESIIWHVDGIIEGYNKSQETHPNSDDDMVEFADWCETNYDDLKPYTIKELLQLWKEQKTKTLYYET